MFKFLDGAGCTYYNEKPFAYNLPRNDEKWATTVHPEPATPDGKSYGPGRLHLMKRLSAIYAPKDWWVWWAEGEGKIGEDNEKASFTAVRLRRIPRPVFERMLRPPFAYGAGANLQEANLWGANLQGANLQEADLRGANLWRANLRGANLQEAGLQEANLREANLRGAYLREAGLWEANLRGADLRGADLQEADLRRAGFDKFTQLPPGTDTTTMIKHSHGDE